MDFTIVTPSFRQLDQLGCCIASVADQGLCEGGKRSKGESAGRAEALTVEHIVQDGGTEGFGDFTKKMAQRWPDRPGYQRVMVSEKDEGMYDAINRGLAKAQGSICGYLNCDEQYLPDTLKRVAEAFRANPDVDLFFGDALVLDKKGHARCWRKVLIPLVAHTWTCHFSAFTAAMFFRRKLLEKGIRFDTRYRAAADAAWYLEARRRGVRIGTLGFVASTFVETGENLGMSPQAKKERERLTQTAPRWMRFGRGLWRIFHRLRRWVDGSLRPCELDYAVYLSGQIQRMSFHKQRVPGYWPGRWRLP